MRTVRLRAALPALAGAALLTGTLLSTPAEAAGGVRIHHVWFDSPGSDNRSNKSLNAEWVQLKNTSGSAVSLKGWVLKDASNHKYVFPNVKIGAGAEVEVGERSARHVRRAGRQPERRRVGVLVH
ncbi:lamin tail domain-containing protein, partial [Streptomyces sp. NPDC051132]|uniref:lamin tail domain-containing protein n=1 Tax=Streptomyces sp. NPDC051132 TaxID=3155667 RepID=UPI00341313F0